MGRNDQILRVLFTRNQRQGKKREKGGRGYGVKNRPSRRGKKAQGETKKSGKEGMNKTKTQTVLIVIQFYL